MALVSVVCIVVLNFVGNAVVVMLVLTLWLVSIVFVIMVEVREVIVVVNISFVTVV